VIDCNRPPSGNTGLIVETSDGATIPANAGLTPAEIEQRLVEIHRPYHDRIAAILRDRAATGTRHILLMMHSFTPRMNGLDRPWRLGVLHLHDSPYSNAVLVRLQDALGDAVGDNEPYAMDGTDYSAPRHSGESGFDYLELEVRQDLIATAEQQTEMADWLAPILRDALADIRG